MAAERAPLAYAVARHVIGCGHSWRVLAMCSSTSEHDDMGLPPFTVRPGEPVKPSDGWLQLLTVEGRGATGEVYPCGDLCFDRLSTNGSTSCHPALVAAMVALSSTGAEGLSRVEDVAAGTELAVRKAVEADRVVVLEVRWEGVLA